jgi:hypothetical protein
MRSEKERACFSHSFVGPIAVKSAKEVIEMHCE